MVARYPFDWETPISSSRRVICDVLRILAVEIRELKLPEEKEKELFKLLEEAFSMGKSMNDKLLEYKTEKEIDEAVWKGFE